MVMRPETSSTAAELRSSVRSRASASFSYFVRAVLGKRRLAEERLEAVASGEAAATASEGELLRRWQELRSGRVPKELSWSFVPEAPDGGA